MFLNCTLNHEPSTQLDGAADNQEFKYENPFGGESVEAFGCGVDHSVAT